MDQKEIVEKIFVRGLMDASKLFEVLERLASISFTELWNQVKPLDGEVDMNTFWSKTRGQSVEKLELSNKIDLEQFKKVFQSYNIGCAYKQEATGTTLYFRAIDKKVVEMASREIFTELLRNPEKIKVLLKNPKRMSFYEKVDYMKQKQFKTTQKQVMSKKALKK